MSPLRDLGPRPWLVLGGGGLKGLAHIGAWRALEEARTGVDGIIGTSIGALVGACVAGGMGWGALASSAVALRRSDIVRVHRRAIWVNGIRQVSLFRGDVLRGYIASILPVTEWTALHHPLEVNAVDLSTGRTQWFGVGARTDLPLTEAVYASAALPVFFPPAEAKGTYLVDGAVEDALPARRPLKLGATGVVAVDVGSGPEEDAGQAVAQGMLAVHQRVFSIMSGRRRRELASRWQGPPLLYVRPRLDGYPTFDFDNIEYFLEEGYRAMSEALTRTEATDPNGGPAPRWRWVGGKESERGAAGGP